MELTKAILEFAGRLLWPATVISLVLLFRKHLMLLIPKISSVKAGGIEVTMKLQEMVIGAVEAANETAPDLRFQIDDVENVPQDPQRSRDAASTMLTFAAGKSYTENLKYGIYYDPATRNHSLPFEYIGLYRQGAVRAVGKVSRIVYCDYDEETGKLVSTNDFDLGVLTEEEYFRIVNIITKTEYYDLDYGCKFFIVDQFYETLLDCDTVIRGKQYFWLDEYSGFKPGMSARELAQLLRRC